MDDKQLSKLKRRELLELMVMISEENDQLREENMNLKRDLEEREAIVNNAGSIADATLKITDFFNAVQQTAECYLENVRKLGIRSEGNSKKLMEIARKEFKSEHISDMNSLVYDHINKPTN